MDHLIEATTTLPAGAIDCDVHPGVPRRADLLPYLDDYWRDTMMSRDIDVLELASAPTRGAAFHRSDWNDAPETGIDKLRAQLLEPFGVRQAICNFVFGLQAIFDPYLATALCRATNDWIAKEWLDRDPRLLASIVVPLNHPDAAAEEIERLAGDRRFVQVLMLSAGEIPLGRRYHWPIYAAAEKHGLPVGVHAGSGNRHAPTQSGYPSHLVEDLVGQTNAFAAQLASFLAEGVFQKFPGLKVVLIESGITWLPSLMWRMSKDWRGVRTEVPWVKSTPAAILRDHVRLTMQPFDAPQGGAEIARILDHLGSDEMVLFSSDYPHARFEGTQALPAGIPDSLMTKLLTGNALATYPRIEVAT